MSSFSKIAYDAFGQASEFVMHAATGNRMLGATALGAGALAITSVVAVRKASSTTNNNSRKALYATALASAVAAVGLTYLAYTQYKADLTVEIYPKNWVKDIGAVERNSEDIAQAEFEKQYRLIAPSIQKAGYSNLKFSYNKPEFTYQPVKNALGHILKGKNGVEVRVPTVTYTSCTEKHYIDAKCTWSWRNALSLLLHPLSPHCETTLTVGSYSGTPLRAMPSDLPPAVATALNSAIGLTSSNAEAEGAKVPERMNETDGKVDEVKPIALNSTDRSYAVALLTSPAVPLLLAASLVGAIVRLATNTKTASPRPANTETTPPGSEGPCYTNEQSLGYTCRATEAQEADVIGQLCIPDREEILSGEVCGKDSERNHPPIIDYALRKAAVSLVVQVLGLLLLTQVVHLLPHQAIQA